MNGDGEAGGITIGIVAADEGAVGLIGFEIGGLMDHARAEGVGDEKGGDEEEEHEGGRGEAFSEAVDPVERGCGFAGAGDDEDDEDGMDEGMADDFLTAEDEGGEEECEGNDKSEEALLEAGHDHEAEADLWWSAVDRWRVIHVA